MDFTNVCMLLGAKRPDAITEVHSDILCEYSQCYRYYHNNQHIDECQAELDSLDLDDIEKAVISFALYEHDIVILPHELVILPHAHLSGIHCETLSGYRCSYDCNRLGIDLTVADKIISLIHATDLKNQEGSQFCTSTKIIADIDISILGKDFDHVMSRMEEGIRLEYFYVPDDVYKIERIKVLKQLLKDGFVYHTPYFRSKYNQKAVENIKRLMSHLGE